MWKIIEIVTYGAAVKLRLSTKAQIQLASFPSLSDKASSLWHSGKIKKHEESQAHPFLQAKERNTNECKRTINPVEQLISKDVFRKEHYA